MGMAQIKVKLALSGDPNQTFVPEDQIECWQDHVNVTQAGEILGRYFMQTEAHFDVPIAETLHRLDFRINYAIEAVEDATLIAHTLALRHHHDQHGEESAVTMNQLALVIEAKLPNPSQIRADYTAVKVREIGDGFDTPAKVLQRIKKVIGNVRSLRRTVAKYGPYDFEYVSPSLNGSTVGPSKGAATASVEPATRQERAVMIPCHTCGNTGHSREVCFFINLLG